jgi:hypothetical protein
LLRVTQLEVLSLVVELLLTNQEQALVHLVMVMLHKAEQEQQQLQLVQHKHREQLKMEFLIPRVNQLLLELVLPIMLMELLQLKLTAILTPKVNQPLDKQLNLTQQVKVM